jgi:nitrous oxide reductase
MPGNDQQKSQPQSQVSRRSLLGAAGVGAAGLAAGAFGGVAAASAATAAKPAASEPHQSEPLQADDRQDSGEPVVVHVRAGRNGDLDVYHGTSHTRVNDPGLAARLRQTTR